MAAAGAPLGGRYQLVADSTGKIDILGSGAFGIVCRAVDLQQNTIVALKLIFKTPGEPLRVGGELVLQHIQPHANVVRLLDYYPSMSSTELPMTHLAESLDPERPCPKSVFRTFRNGRFVAPMDAIEIAVLVFECIEGKELFDWLMEDGPEWWHGRDAAMDRPAESDVRGVMAGLVRAVAHLHSMGVCHLDLKLENVKLTAAAAGVPPSERARLLDFGFAEAGPNIGQLRCGRRGTETYMAPEMHTALSYDGCKADVFALGVCLYTLANKSPPCVMIPQDMTAASLAAAPPEQQKQLLGERLFPLISQVQPASAGKITDMLLEMDNGELLSLLESPEALNAKIMEAVSVLEMHAAEGDVSPSQQIIVSKRSELEPANLAPVAQALAPPVAADHPLARRLRKKLREIAVLEQREAVEGAVLQANQRAKIQEKSALEAELASLVTE